MLQRPIRVLHALRLINRIDPLTEIVAEKIFGVAQTGEFDTGRITELTLMDFQNTLVTAAEPEHGFNQRAEELRRSRKLIGRRSVGGAWNRAR